MIKSLPLKIKLASLAAEIRIIKAEESRLERLISACPSDERGKKWAQAHSISLASIRNHRYQDVRTEARDTLLAYSFLRGRAYKRIEPSRYTDPKWSNIERMILKYGAMKAQIAKQAFEQWKQEAGVPKSKTTIVAMARKILPLISGPVTGRVSHLVPNESAKPQSF